MASAPGSLSRTLAPGRQDTIAAARGVNKTYYERVNRLRARWLPASLVAIATFLVFLPALGNGFVNWDDDENFLWNPHYRGLGWTQLRWMFTAVHQGLYVPLAWVTLGLDHVLWGMRPSGYHLTSVLFHAANAAVLYLVAERLLGRAIAGAGPRAVRLGAGAAALAFSLHPLRAESVAWVTERRDVVAGLFTLLAVLAYLRALAAGDDGASRHLAGRTRGYRAASRWYWAGVACFGLALLAKSIVVGLPLVLLIIDAYPLDRVRRVGIARLAIEKLPFVALSAAVGALTLGILAGHRLLVNLGTMDLAQRLAVSGYGLAFYLGKTVAPWPLSPIYTLFHPVEPWSARYLVPAAIVLAITGAALAAARRWPAGLAVWGAYALLVAPVLGLVHSGPQLAADRYSYFCAMPLAVLAGAGVTWCADAAARGRIAPRVGAAALLAAALALAGLSALTVRQVAVWRDSVTLWQHAALVSPESDIPVFYLGWALDGAGRADEARAHFTRALDRVPPTLPQLRAQVYLHRGIVARRAGDARAAADDFRSALAVDPGHPVAQIRLALALAALGERAEADAAFARAAQLAPSWPRYQLWEIRAAVREVPADEPARRALGWALTALLALHGVREPGDDTR